MPSFVFLHQLLEKATEVLEQKELCLCSYQTMQSIWLTEDSTPTHLSEPKGRTKLVLKEMQPYLLAQEGLIVPAVQQISPSALLGRTNQL